MVIVMRKASFLLCTAVLLAPYPSIAAWLPEIGSGRALEWRRLHPPSERRPTPQQAEEARRAFEDMTTPPNLRPSGRLHLRDPSEEPTLSGHWLSQPGLEWRRLHDPFESGVTPQLEESFKAIKERTTPSDLRSSNPFLSGRWPQSDRLTALHVAPPASIAATVLEAHTQVVEQLGDGFLVTGPNGPILAPTMDNLVDQLLSTHLVSGDPLGRQLVRFNGIAADRVDAILRTARLSYASRRGHDDATAFIASPDALSSTEIARQLTWNYTWGRAEVDRSAIAIREIDDSKGLKRTEISVPTRVVPVGRPPVLVRVVIHVSAALDRIFPAAVADSLVATVTRFMDTEARNYTQLDRMITALQRQLDADFPAMDHLIHVGFGTNSDNPEAVDIVIAGLARPPGHPGYG